MVFGSGGKSKTEIESWDNSEKNTMHFQICGRLNEDDCLNDLEKGFQASQVARSNSKVTTAGSKRSISYPNLLQITFIQASHRYCLQASQKKICFILYSGKYILFWPATNIYLSCTKSAYWIVTFAKDNILSISQLYHIPSKTKIFGSKIIIGPHMPGTLTNERKEQCRVKLVMLTFTEWLSPPTPFDALTPEFQRLWWASELGWGLWRESVRCAD